MTADMPGRPRQHELETLCQRAFEAGLPADWVARRVSDDYGIDLHVELFKDRQATGLVFAVQLKAVERLAGAPSVRLKWSTRNYWVELGMPTLVVLWDAASGRMWWQWAHRFDPWGLDRNTKTFTFTFPSDNTWDEGITPGELAREVLAWRALDRRDYCLPIQVVLTPDAPGIASHPVSKLRAALRHLSNPHTDVLRITQASTEHVHFRVEPAEDQTAVWLSGSSSFTIHHEGGVAHGPDFAEQWAADILLAAAAMLIRFGLVMPAARVAGTAAPHASIVLDPDIAADIVSLLMDANRVDDVVALYDRLISHAGEDSLPQNAASVTLLEHGNTLDFTARQSLVTALMSRSDDVPDHGAIHGAQLAYLASQLIGDADPQQAAALLEDAARRDPGYRERDYWHRELGGALFLSGDFAGAVEAYRRAVELGNKAAPPLLADALLYAGRYAQAAKLIATITADPAMSKPEWRVKHYALTFLAEQLVLRDQDRQPEAAARAADDAGADRTALMDALKLDVLCPEALFALGQAAEQAGQPSAGWYCAASISALYHPVGWLAAMTPVQTEAPHLFDDLLRCAHRFAGQEIVSLALQADASGEMTAGLMELFDSLPEEPARGTEVRFTTPGSGEYVSMRAPERTTEGG